VISLKEVLRPFETRASDRYDDQLGLAVAPTTRARAYAPAAALSS
jgi:hypothetical protein